MKADPAKCLTADLDEHDDPPPHPHKYHTVRHIAGHHVSVIAVMLLSVTLPCL